MLIFGKRHSKVKYMQNIAEKCLYFFYIFAWFQAVKHMIQTNPKLKVCVHWRKLKRVIVYWKYYDKEMYDFYHFPHWTSHAVFCNITYDIWIKYSRGFYNYVYTAFYLTQCFSVLVVHPNKKKKIKKFRPVKYRWSK